MDYVYDRCACIFSSCSSDETHTLYKIETGGKYGYIDSLGIEIIKPQYLLASDFNEGLAVIVVDTLTTKGIGFSQKIQYHINMDILTRTIK